MTDWKESLSGSEKPKSEASKVCEASSRMVMVLSVPAGASFAGDVEGDGVGGLIGVLSVIGGTAVVRDLEGDGGVSVAIGVSGWSEDEIADITDSNDIAVVDSVSVESEWSQRRLWW